MPIQTKWLKKEVAQKNEDLIKTKAIEWKKAKEHAAMLLKSKAGKDLQPFKISRKELQKLDPDNEKKYQHSFLVVPDEKGGFELAVMARGKAYYDDSEKEGEEGVKVEVKEGILGHGAFGMVKLVQFEDKSTYAVKIEGSANSSEEKLAERKIMKKLGNLRAAFVRERKDATEWIGDKQIKDKSYTIQKLALGEELQDFLKGFDFQLMDPEEKSNVALQSALAVKRLHDKNIIHCDIKPGNFMIDIQGKTTIVESIDFGLSKELEPYQTTLYLGGASGSPRYMAPEIGEWEIDKTNPKKPKIAYTSEGGLYSKASDIYALGVMLRHDLKLAEPDSPLKGLIDQMTDKNYLLRPSINDVARVLSNPEHYAKYSDFYKQLKTYSDDYHIRNESYISKAVLYVSRNLKINTDEQINMVDALNEVMHAHEESQSKEEITNTAEKVLQILKDNQNKHNKTWFSGPSNFNFGVIQKLPQKLQTEVLEQLKIDKDGELFKENSYKNRAKLAEIINKFEPPKEHTSYKPSLLK